MKRIAFTPALLVSLLACSPLHAQSALPPAEDLGRLERMVVTALGAGVGEPGGPMVPIDRRMRLAACPGGVQIDPSSAGAVTVRCTSGSSWRLRIPLSHGAGMAIASPSGGIANAAVRKGDPVELIAQGEAYSVSVNATAMEDGDIGRRIRVSSPSKGATLFAEVVDAGRVRLIGFK